jgi:hypothetical protein
LILVFAEQFMAAEMVLGECDEFGWCAGAYARKDLRVNVGGEVLNADGTEAAFRGDYNNLIYAMLQ